MALLTVNFMSETLMRNISMNVILPADKITFPGMPKEPEKPFPALYLLHGIFGNYTDWITGTSILQWAEKKNLAVVMPSGENAFYVDQEAGHNYYGEFIGRELVEITRKMFRLSDKREDTFIGGLSMGGYGAVRNGLKYHKTFGCIAALSAAMIIDDIEKRDNHHPLFIERRSFAQAVFGDLDGLKYSDKNPVWLAEKLSREGIELPKVYLACGTQDSLLNVNRKLRDDLTAAGMDVTYEEDSGGHDWDFWNRQIKKVLEWLPLDTQKSEGMHSGNIGI